MLPSQIDPRQFEDYSPQARHVATRHIKLLQQLPLALAALLVEQIQQYDWKFPAERREIDGQLSYLSSLSRPQMDQVLSGFGQLQLSPQLEHINWVESPHEFSEALSAYLWRSGQIDAFRRTANSFILKVDAATPPLNLPLARLGIALIGKGVTKNSNPLFRRLRPHGTYFTRIDPSNGLRILLDMVSARAAARPIPFGHWYIDGGPAEPVPDSSLISVSYTALQPVRTALLHKVTRAINQGIGGPEALSGMLQKIRPQQIGLSRSPQDAVLSHFEASVFTGGQGTQIFSTTFVQWTARELWRRAQPLTILARFAPRQRERPMNELLSGKDASPELDPAGSLIDADMGAFLTWIDQQRLPGAERACFLAWFENHSEALVISPHLPRNTESGDSGDMNWLLSQMGLKTPANGKSHLAPAATLQPEKDNYVLDGTDNNEDMKDFFNWANYKGSG